MALDLGNVCIVFTPFRAARVPIYVYIQTLHNDCQINL